MTQKRQLESSFGETIGFLLAQSNGISLKLGSSSIVNLSRETGLMKGETASFAEVDGLCLGVRIKAGLKAAYTSLNFVEVEPTCFMACSVHCGG